MLKFLTLGAALATISSTSIAGSPLIPAENTEHRIQATTSNLVASQEVNNASTELTHAKTLIALADTSRTPEVAEEVNLPGIIVGLAAVGGVATAVALNGRNAKKALSTGSISDHYSSRLSLTSQAENIRIDQASRNLQKKLLRLLHDDRDTANRLLSQVKRNNPNRPINWCVEKVIYDLERDRRS